MGIAKRMIRIFKSDIHGVMDQLEDQGLLLKQYLRDMEEALRRKEAKLKKIVVSRSLAARQRDNYKLEIEKLEHDLGIAIRRDKDDIARMLIRKLKPLNALRDDFGRQIEALDDEIMRFKEHIEQQRLQYEQLKQRAVEYFHQTEQKEWQKTPAAFTPGIISHELSEEEVELELLQRKELLKGGALP
jgi:phage shock protein A